jgi:hypothetical protein
MHSLRSFFVYEREKDQTLVIGAGILEDWVRDPNGVEVKRLPTYYGVLNYKMAMRDNRLHVELDGDLQMPPGQIMLKSPLAVNIKTATVNGKKSKSFTSHEMIVEVFLAKIILSYGSN